MKSHVSVVGPYIGPLNCSVQCDTGDTTEVIERMAEDNWSFDREEATNVDGRTRLHFVKGEAEFMSNTHNRLKEMLK